MATFDATAGQKVTSATTNTYSHTVASQSNRIILVAVDAGQTVSGITYAGTALTNLTSNSGQGGGEVLSLWYLLAPATGANNVVVTCASSTYIIASSASYYNVAQTSTFGTVATNSGTGATSSTNTVVTTSSTQLVYDAMNNTGGVTDTATASQTKRFQPTSSGMAEGDIAATGSNMTLTWSWTGAATWAQNTVAMNAASSGAALSGTIHGVGTLAGTTSLKTSLAKAIAGVGTLSGTTSRKTALARTLAGIGTLAGTLTTTGPIPGVSVTIAGSPVMILEGSFEIDDAINAVSTCMFTVRDDTGLNHYKKRQKITITDSIRGLYYTGFINAVVEDNVRPQALIFSKVSVRDNHSIPEQRTYQGPEYVNEYAGPIAADMLNTLAADGITAQYASRRETTQAQLALGTLTNTTAQSNVGFGDLELSPSGTAVTVAETGATFATGTVGNTTVIGTSLAQTAFNAIKIQATNAINNAGNTYSYYKVWSGSYTILSSPVQYLYYDVFITKASPEYKIGVDLVCSDGTTLRDNATSNSTGGNFGYDNQDLSPHPATDLSGFADGKWYHRQFSISAFLGGKTLSYVSVAVEGDKTGLYTGYFRNIYIGNYAGASSKDFFKDATTSLNTSQQLQNYGYSTTTVLVASCYTISDHRWSPSYSISGAGINSSTLISWTTTTNATLGAANGSSVQVGYSFDGVNYILCTNNAILPDFPAGLSVAGLSLYFVQFLNSGTTPEDTIYLNQMVFQLNPGYSGTKTDSITNVNSNATWSAGTFSNTTNNGGSALSLSGITQNWTSGVINSQPLYGGPNSEEIVKSNTLLLAVDGIGTTGYDAKSQFSFAPQYQNFTAEIDVLIGGWDAGLFYRTTNFGTGAGTYAFAACVSPTAVYIVRGSNSTSSTNVVPALKTSTAVSLTAGNWHRLKVVVNGTSHQAYLDDVLMVSVTDTNFNASGYVGAIIRNGNASAPTHREAQFNNFGIMPALTGTWISPSISLNALGTYYSSDVFYANGSTDTINTTITTDYTINGGSTWTNIPTALDANGDARGVLALVAGASLVGVSLAYRFTLTTTTASSMPSMNNFQLKILGGFTASGTRVSANLALTNVGRLGSSLVAWNSNLPTGCTLGVDTSVDGGSWTDVTASPGGTIPGLTVQPVATDDTFNTNTSANYTSTNATGGSTATWTYDTANSRITATSGSKALYVLNTVSGSTDVDLIIDMDESDAGGLIWHYVDVNNYYELVVADASASTNPNTFNLFKTVAGTRTQLQTNLAISFTRGTYHRIRMVMKSNLMTCSMDGVVITNTTDGALASGKSGLRSDGGTARFYQLRVQPLGQDVTTHYVQMRLRLASTNPLATPQVLNTTLSAFGNTIQVGALIPQTAYNGKYVSANFDDLIKQCSASGGQWWWYIDKNKQFSMLPNTGVPSPWIASDNPGDFLDAGLTVTDQSDLYCNHVIVQNVLQTTTINEARQGDNVTRSWTFGYEWASAPTILVNGIAASVGVKNVDTGKTFYYAVGDPTITIDASVTTYTSLYIINFSGTGQYLTNAVADNTTEQVAVASIDGTSGIVEFIIDGTGLTYAAGLAKAQAYVAQFSVRGKLINATTIHDGLACGQLLNVFLPQHGIFDGLFLIRGIKTHLTSGAGAGGQYQTFWYTIEAISGPDIGSWEQLYRKS